MVKEFGICSEDRGTRSAYTVEWQHPPCFRKTPFIVCAGLPLMVGSNPKSLLWPISPDYLSISSLASVAFLLRPPRIPLPLGFSQPGAGGTTLLPASTIPLPQLISISSFTTQVNVTSSGITSLATKHRFLFPLYLSLIPMMELVVYCVSLPVNR